MDATQPPIPDLDELERKLRSASAEHDDGRHYVRASVAAELTGIAESYLRYWRRTNQVVGLKFRIPPCAQVPNGRLAVYEVESLIERTRRYWSGPRKWSRAEDDYLLEHLGRVSIAELAQTMRRTEAAIVQRAGKAFGVSQINAQGELTTIQTARLCGVWLRTVQQWCEKKRRPLRYRRLPDKAGSRMIELDSLARFFKDNPQIYANRTEEARARIDRACMPAGLRRKAVSV